MLVELDAKSQITIPKSIVDSMELKEGDRFEVITDGGKIVFIPVILSSKYVVENLEDTCYNENTN